MQEKWKEIWKKWNKKILIIMLCIIIFLVLGIIVANAKKMQIIFDPSVYSDSKDKEEESVDYDSAVFGADQKNKDGLEMDDESEESYDLDEGDEKLLDDQNNESSQGLQIADGDESGNGASSENRNTVGVTNDENGATILGTNQNRPMSGGSGTGEGTGGPGTSSGDGNGSGTGTGSGGSTGNPGTGTEEGGGSGTGSSENPGPDPDEDKYGTDYNEKEEIDSVFPDEAEDQEKGITAVSLKISKGSLRQHFFEGEAPRCSEMMEYITVDATMSDGSVRKNLLYHPTSDYDFGGDYTVTWEANPDNTLNQYGYPIVGKDVSKKDYTATITYRGVSCKTSYDIVHWELNLKDFDEAEQEDSFVEPYVQQYIENTTNISPKDTPVIDLYDPMQAMYNLIEARTESHDDPETTAQYRYINKKRDGAGEYDAYYVEYFGGWTDAADMESTGNIYKMKRPTDAQIKDGEYIVDMIPVWSDEESKGDYQIGLYGVLDTTWSTELLGYSGDSSTLIVPQGTTRFSIPSMYYYAWGEGDELQDTKIKKLVLPASLYEYENIPSTDYVNFFPNLEEIEVSADNQYYMSIDGVLYNRTGKLLMSVPAGKKSIDEWSTRPFQIMPDAFQYVNMDRVDVPANVSICGINSFFNATIGTLTINYPGTLTLGMSAFDSCLLDENYS
ncbi:MAG: hypothetical protein EOM18_13130, partial [Clostridia bacterium]|nr:hypothetical protein [Clostridia bacterium]